MRQPAVTALARDPRRQQPDLGKLKSRLDCRDLYQALVGTPDATGHTGDIRWNFEKFLIAPDGAVAARFAPQTEPDADELVGVIEKTLPA